MDDLAGSGWMNGWLNENIHEKVEETELKII